MTLESKNINDLVTQRYAQALPINALSNPIIEHLLKHYSVRNYTSQALPENALELIVAAASAAPTSSNLQVWSVVAVEDAQRKERLSMLAGNQAHIRDCPIFLLWIADLARLEKQGELKNLPHAGLDYFEMFLTASLDATLAAQNAALAAESLGLGIVYIGGIRNKPEEVAKELNLPSNSFAVFGMCIGYCDPEVHPEIKPRLPQSLILHKEQYQLNTSADIFNEYCQSMSEFNQRQKMSNKVDWVSQCLHRVRGPESLSGRDHLVEALKNLGFKLK
ncbi:MAG: nitroreductase family protein [Betaproteobacteria bacterium]|jgi:nitroreductase